MAHRSSNWSQPSVVPLSNPPSDNSSWINCVFRGSVSSVASSQIPLPHYPADTVDFFKRIVRTSAGHAAHDKLGEPLAAVADFVTLDCLHRGPTDVRKSVTSANVYKRTSLAKAPTFPGHVVLALTQAGFKAKYNHYSGEARHHMIHATLPDKVLVKSSRRSADMVKLVAQTLKAVFEQLCESPCDQLILPMMHMEYCPQRLQPKMPRIMLEGLMDAFASLSDSERRFVAANTYRVWLCAESEEVRASNCAAYQSLLVEMNATQTAPQSAPQSAPPRRSSVATTATKSEGTKRVSIMQKQRVSDWSQMRKSLQDAEQARKQMEQLERIEESNSGASSGSAPFSPPQRTSCRSQSGSRVHESMPEMEPSQRRSCRSQSGSRMQEASPETRPSQRRSGRSQTGSGMHESMPEVVPSQPRTSARTSARIVQPSEGSQTIILDASCNEAVRSIKWKFTSRGAIVSRYGDDFHKYLGGQAPPQIGALLVRVGDHEVSGLDQQSVIAYFRAAQQRAQDLGHNKFVMKLCN